MRYLNLILMLFLLSSCGNNIENNSEYKDFVEKYTFILATDEKNQIVDFVKFDPSRKEDLSEIEIYVDDKHPKLEFILIGNHVHKELNKKYKFIKMASQSKVKSFNAATFSIYENKIAHFSGNGMGVGKLTKSHMDFVKKNYQKKNYKHRLQVVEGIIIDWVEQDGIEKAVFAYHDLSTNEIKLKLKWATDYGGLAWSGVEWEDALPEWIQWKDEYLKTKT